MRFIPLKTIAEVFINMHYRDLSVVHPFQTSLDVVYADGLGVGRGKYQIESTFYCY